MRISESKFKNLDESFKKLLDDKNPEHKLLRYLFEHMFNEMASDAMEYENRINAHVVTIIEHMLKILMHKGNISTNNWLRTLNRIAHRIKGILKRSKFKYKDIKERILDWVDAIDFEDAYKKAQLKTDPIIKDYKDNMEEIFILLDEYFKIIIDKKEEDYEKWIKTLMLNENVINRISEHVKRKNSPKLESKEMLKLHKTKTEISYSEKIKNAIDKLNIENKERYKREAPLADIESELNHMAHTIYRSEADERQCTYKHVYDKTANMHDVINYTKESTFPQWFRDLDLGTKRNALSILKNGKSDKFVKLVELAIGRLENGYQDYDSYDEPNNGFLEIIKMNDEEYETYLNDVPF